MIKKKPSSKRTPEKRAEPTVGEVMTQVVVTLSPESSIQEAIDLFARRHISGAPVVSARGELMGVISTTDLLRAQSGDAPSPAEAPDFQDEIAPPGERASPGEPGTVLEIATRRVVSIDEDAPLSQAAKTLLDLGIRRLFVTRRGKLAGLLSATDVIKWVARPALEAELSSS